MSHTAVLQEKEQTVCAIYKVSLSFYYKNVYCAATVSNWKKKV